MLIAWRDLQYRRRRFAISIVAVGVVFGIALLLSGLSAAFGNESRRVVTGFDADAWIVGAGTSGPFTSTKLLPLTTADTLAATPGITEVVPLIASAGTADDANVNLLGLDLTTRFAPDLSDGRLPEAPFEVVADRSLGVGLSRSFDLAASTWTVVGRTDGQRYLAGVPVVFARFDDVRAVQLEGIAATTSFMVTGTPTGALPAGLESMSDAEAIASLEQPLESAVGTIDAVRILLWIVAAGIIGSIVYLTVLERIRDIAVLKAVGSSNGSILFGLVFQAVVIALAATVVAVLVAKVLGPTFPMAVEIPASAFAMLPVVAIVIAGLASLIGVRRAVGIDPALAFGG